jgi:8-oxo-dGTP diphosphatase
VADALTSTSLVRAAGGIVWRSAESGEVEVLIVHRPKYDDWTFPKGKNEPGEADDVCALREVAEETGFRCTLGPELISTQYIDRKNRPKEVRYWVMTVEDGEFAATDEVDELQWVTPSQARWKLSYDRDRDVLEAFLNGTD